MLKKLDLNKINGYLLLIFASAFPLSRAVASIFMAYFVLYFLYTLITKNLPKDFFKNRVVIALLLYITYMFSTNLWNGIDNKIYGINYYQWFAIFGIAIYLYKNPQYVYKTITAFIFGMLVSEILSYGMYFDLWTINGKGSSDPTPVMIHIMYSVFLAFTSLLLLNRILSNKYSVKEKIFLSIFFITVTGNLFVSNSRTGALAFLVAIFVAIFLHLKIKIKNIIIVSLLIPSLFFLAYKASPNFQRKIDVASIQTKKILNNNLNSSIGVRFAMIILTPRLIENNKIFGLGIRGKDKVMAQLVEDKKYNLSSHYKEFLTKAHLHNQYSQTLVEGGIVGILLLFFLYYNILKLPFNDGELKELSIIFLVVYMVGSIGDPLLIKQFTRILFIVFIGIFLGASLQTRIKND